MSDTEARSPEAGPEGSIEPHLGDSAAQSPVVGDTTNVNNSDDDDDDGLGLFGDDDDEEEEAPVARSRNVVADDDEEEEEEEEEYDKVREEDLKTLEISLVRHSKSHHKLDDELIKLQIPTYIGIDAHPFDPTKFEESVQDNSGNKTQELDDKLLAENTIRWRYSTNKSGDVYRQSNTQVIEWDDGSYSLKLGSEIFDVVMRPNEDNFLVMTHDDQDILQTQEILTRVAKIVPTSTSSAVHKRLTKAITNRQLQLKQHKMKSIILKEDPELRLRALEKLEEESIKARRRAELKRLQDEERLERGSPAPTRSSRSYYSALDEEEEEEEDDGIDVRRNEYDEDDGFIDDDEDDEGDEELLDEDEEEDELDKAAERLKKVKEAGAAKYDQTSTRSRSESSDDDKVSRKKRRIISDDEDDE